MEKMEKEKETMERKMKEELERKMKEETEKMERQMKQEIARMEEERQEEKLCVVCLDAEANCLFLNCGHIRVCWDCAEWMETCCMCQVPIENQRKRVYM